MVTAKEVQREQEAVVAEILSMIGAAPSPEIVRAALRLAHNRGYQAGLDVAMSIFTPSKEAPSHVTHA